MGTAREVEGQVSARTDLSLALSLLVIPIHPNEHGFR